MPIPNLCPLKDDGRPAKTPISSALDHEDDGGSPLVSRSVMDLFDNLRMEHTTGRRRSTTLRTVILMGSARDTTPHWGGAARLGERVLKLIARTMKARSARIGSSAHSITHDVSIFDPINVFGPGGALEASGCEVRSPHFLLPPGAVPPAMEAMRRTLANADCFLVITPEYNHSCPPSLLSMIDHFKADCFLAKCSGIIAYSKNPAGGAFAASAIVPVLHKIGALPVSKMVILPDPATVLDEEGTPLHDEDPVLAALPKMLDQLEWTAQAFKSQREATGLWTDWPLQSD